MSQQITLEDLTRDGAHYARRGPTGLIEIVNTATGSVVRALRSLHTPGEVQETLEGYVTHIAYDPFVVDLICERVATGESVTKVCKEPGMPAYAVFSKWVVDHPDAAKKLELARVARTEYLRDLAVQTAMENEDFKFPTQAAKLKVDTLIWAAGVDNPKYSPKAKVEATFSAPVQILVSTGIVREESKSREAVAVEPTVTSIAQPVERVPGVDGGVPQVGEARSVSEIAAEVCAPSDVGTF